MQSYCWANTERNTEILSLLKKPVSLRSNTLEAKKVIPVTLSHRSQLFWPYDLRCNDHTACSDLINQFKKTDRLNPANTSNNYQRNERLLTSSYKKTPRHQLRKSILYSNIRDCGIFVKVFAINYIIDNDEDCSERVSYSIGNQCDSS